MTNPLTSPTARCATPRADPRGAQLDRLARSVPDARAIGDDLAARGIKLSLGGQVYDPRRAAPC